MVRATYMWFVATQQQNRDHSSMPRPKKNTRFRFLLKQDFPLNGRYICCCPCIKLPRRNIPMHRAAKVQAHHHSCVQRLYLSLLGVVWGAAQTRWSTIYSRCNEDTDVSIQKMLFCRTCMCMNHIMVPLYKHSSNDTAPALAYLMWFVAGPAHPRNEIITETVLYVTNSNFWLHPTHTGGCLGVWWVHMRVCVH